MYVDDPRDFGLGPRWEDEWREARAEFDDDDSYETDRARTSLHNEAFDEE